MQLVPVKQHWDLNSCKALHPDNEGRMSRCGGEYKNDDSN